MCFIIFHEVSGMGRANSLLHKILTGFIWSITLISFFNGKKNREDIDDQREVKRSLTSGQEQISRKTGFLSNISAHKCNRQTLENKVSLINAQNAL